MYAPGGFDARLEKWSTQSIYAEIKLLDHLPATLHVHCCSTGAKRDSRADASSGMTWAHYAAQGKGMLDHLGIERAHVMGGCMGVSAALAFAVAYPARDVQPDAVLARRRRELSHERAAALRRAPCVREAVRPSGRRRLVAREKQAVRRRPARRTVGIGDRARSGVRRRVRAAAVRAYTRDRRGDGTRAVRPRHRARRGAGRSACGSTFPRWSCRAATRRTRRRRRAISKSVIPRAQYWDVPGGRANRRIGSRTRILEFLTTRHNNRTFGEHVAETTLAAVKTAPGT